MTSVPIRPGQHESTPEIDLILAAISAAGDALHPCQSYATEHDRAAAAYDLAQSIRCAAPALTEAERAAMAAYLYPEGGNPAQAHQLLLDLVEHEDDPCSYDHHGYCQTHGPGEIPCTIATARQFLGLPVGGQR
jgi:hypothetical protein